MNTLIPPLPIITAGRATKTAAPGGLFRKPHYECQELAEAVQLTVFVPGVDASGVEIAARGPDLVITARKARFVRVNFAAAHLETAQRDYQLRLRLGLGLDYARLEAEMADGRLVITLPKK